MSAFLARRLYRFGCRVQRLCFEAAMQCDVGATRVEVEAEARRAKEDEKRLRALIWGMSYPTKGGRR